MRKKRLNTQRWALRMMDRHGLIRQGWTFMYTRRSRSILGECHFENREIRIPLNTLEQMCLEVEDTILHEIAHALAGAAAGHGPHWQAWCRTIGCRPERCAGEEAAALQKKTAPPAPVPSWRGTCQACGDTFYVSRLTARRKRGRHLCGGRLKWLNVKTGATYDHDLDWQ